VAKQPLLEAWTPSNPDHPNSTETKVLVEMVHPRWSFTLVASVAASGGYAQSANKLLLLTQQFTTKKKS
jgi:hypothetical protein